MAKSSVATDRPKKNHPGRRLAGEVLVAGATYAGSRMADSDQANARKRKSHKMRKLIGLAMVAGAAYATEKYLKSRKNRRRANNTKESS